MKKKKILVISQYFYPEQFRINDICETWVQKGYEVTVLTGIPNYPQGDFFNGYGYTKNRRQMHQGIDIIRIPIIPRKRSSIMLGLNYISYVISGKLWSLFNKKEFDYVFIYEVSPITQAIPAVSIAKRLKIPCYIYVMDLWPENFQIITGINNTFVIGMINKIVDYIYKNCTKIFTASKSFKKNIEERGIDSNKIYFWPQYAEDFYQPAQEKSPKIKQDGKINLTFAGNIGEAQGLDILPAIAEKVKSEKMNVRFNIIGNGRYKTTLIAEIQGKKVDDMFRFIDPVPPEEVPSILNASEFSLITLKKDEILSMTIPAKLQSSMASGAAIFLIADGEAQEIVKESGAGYYNHPDDINGIMADLRKITKKNNDHINQMKQNARKFYEKNFDKKYLLNKMDEFLTK
ncbi:glycosyltransferase family 4 protein [Tetragenococcus koreensis]|uniref:glycosyltransferase family 4 protein n=1 Tax=Tetragenococcus koreensis TaxID=290335 RepID=UPI001F425570|nr:glycosyltransferase family 4 protein [Tetragenococcus koreensis]MCF1619985.1 glycosyltransferase family 4 protein [Tetragenococcus koreensis]MCF1657476.1 glycosyltransferase family 4 protein [Tetragenococcus koreensis]